MMDEEAIVERASRFWQESGREESFPRTLESAVTWTLPLAVVKLPRLGLGTLRRWLAQHRIPLAVTDGNRPLRGALLAYAGEGMLFLDGSDADDERRFSVGHEVAHFLADYLDPRARAIQALGEPAREVLDGLRLPNPGERLTALLRAVELGHYSHWIERSPDGTVARSAILADEDRADRLALELLAPRRVVLDHLAAAGISTVVAATAILEQEFGLPGAQAASYAAFLLGRRSASRTFRQWLGRPPDRTFDRAAE